MEQKSVCLDKIAAFMDKNEHIIISVLGATLDLSCVDNDVESLEDSLTNANKIINRMELLLKMSQRIYQQAIRISA